MLRFAPWAALAMAPLAQARFDWLHARHQAEECCPCPSPGAPDDTAKTVTISEPAGTAHTVTVTEPAGYPSKETITIEHTITQPGKTVYITQTEQYTVTKKVTIPADPLQTHHEEHYKTVTIGNDKEMVRDHVVTITVGDDDEQVKTVTLENAKESNKVHTITIGHSNERVYTKTIKDGDNYHTVTIGNSDDGIVTKTIHDGGKYYTVPMGGSSDRVVTKTIREGDKYYTVPIGGSGDHVVTKTIHDGDKYYTVTIGDSDDHVVTKTIHDGDKYYTVTVGDSDDRVVTKTIREGDKYYTVTIGDSNDRVVTKTIHEDGKPYTVVVKPEPSVQTITLEGGEKTTKTVEVYRTATITAPAQTQTVTKQEYKTITTTVTDSYGQPDVEIIIINIETGKSTCKKKLSGLPCHGKNDYELPEVSILTVTEGSGATETDCSPISVSTSISTVYNTVVMTVGPDGGAAPESTGTATMTEGVEHPVRTGQSAPNSRLRHCLIRPTNSYLLPSNVSYGVPHPELLESRLPPVHSRGRPDHWSPPPSMHPLIPACLAPAAPAWRRMHASPSFPSPRSRSRSHGPAIPSPPHVRSQGFTPTTFKASHGQRLKSNRQQLTAEGLFD
ncbi:hypothetical protein AUP68_08029 [Ilyonectria robusta]